MNEKPNTSMEKYGKEQSRAEMQTVKQTKGWTSMEMATGFDCHNGRTHSKFPFNSLPPEINLPCKSYHYKL